MPKPAISAIGLLILSLILIVAVPAPVAASGPAPTRGAAPPEFAPDHLMVHLTRDAYARSGLRVLDDYGKAASGAQTGLSALDATVRELGVTRISRALPLCNDRARGSELGLDRVFRFDVAAGADIEALVARLGAEPDVELAYPDYSARLAYVPSDPYYAAHWGHDNTAQLPGFDFWGTYDHTLPGTVGTAGFDADADLAWDAPTFFGSASVIIAIIDTGVDLGHADLRLTTGWDYGDNDANPSDDSAAAGHGTCCAGVAAAIPDNAYVSAGVAGGCTVMPLKVADSAGNLWLANAAAAITHAVNNGAHVISMSFGSASTTVHAALELAITNAATAGLVMLSAAGNDNAPVLDYPANLPDVIAVGAASPCGERKRSSSDPNDLLWTPTVWPDPNGYTCDGERDWGSSYGPAVQDGPDAVDVLAPTILPTTDITGTYGYRSGDVEPYFNGTSCSTPYAAGVCALILSAAPTLTPLEVRDKLVSTCTDVVSVEAPTPGWDMYAGYGLVNADMAVQAALIPTAQFVAWPVTGCEPLNVVFTDLSTGPVTGWSWDFGDGGTDMIQHPAHLYTQPGTYTVALTVTGPGGGTTLTMTDLVTVDPVAAPEFSASPTSGFAPLIVGFTDASTGSPDTWDWDFGDGQMDNVQSPVHTYDAPGLYSVSLTASNGCGGDFLMKQDYIAVCDTLVADFDWSDTAGVDTLTVAFTDQSLGIPITSWSWDFGDGDTSADPIPVHFYDAPGRYTVTLIVETPCETDTLTVDEAVVVATSTGAEAPRVFSLAHAAPNPFNPSTTIAFSLEKAGRARLEVFDAAGRRVDVLVDASLAAGPHEATWRPMRLSSGVYFAKLSANGQTAIERMMLVK